VKAAAPLTVLAFEFVLGAAVAKAFALVLDESGHRVESLDVGDLVLRRELPGQLPDQERVAVTGHREDRYFLALLAHIRGQRKVALSPFVLWVGVEGVRKIAQTPVASLFHALPDQPEHITVSLSVHLGHLERVRCQLLAIDADEVLKVQDWDIVHRSAPELKRPA
jgi:hypothetical protein